MVEQLNVFEQALADRGFCRVVGFPAYWIDKSGVVITTHPRSRARDRVLKLVPDKDGYLIAGLWNSLSKRQIRKRVSHLVLITFKGPCPRGMEACHNNRVHTDNHLTNLRWDTPKNNHADAVARGTHTGLTKHGENNPFAKLDNVKVVEMRRLFALGKHRYVDLAKMFGVLPGHVSLIIRRKV